MSLKAYARVTDDGDTNESTADILESTLLELFNVMVKLLRKCPVV